MNENNEHKDFLKKNESQLKKNPFSTPDDYFKSFDESLMSKISEESISDIVGKENGMKVPDNYFESFEENILNKVKTTESTKKKSKIRFLYNSNFYRFASVAVAAVFLILILVQKNTSEVNFDSVSNTELNNWVSLESEDFDTYQLAALYDENDDIIEDDIFYTNNISDEDLELYLNTIEIENLLDSEN
ncbi:hypothetical protein [Aureivirga sp. CE67]|uniref:hypothetical protein n=1 Tax=Aureivirga sp. CE67 TaxID=1788983 RepID=UPI0018CAE937|nr:hypothetical protein [Aureivirga sp. CE67]